MSKISKPNYLPVLLEDNKNNMDDIWDLFLKSLDSDSLFERKKFSIRWLFEFTEVYLIHLDDNDIVEQIIQYQIKKKDVAEAANFLCDLWESAELIKFVEEDSWSKYYKVM